jgi:hypothetical protein
MKNEFYRPATIEFNVAHDGTNVPESFGEFATAEEAVKFLGTNLISTNQPVTVARFMDNHEKLELRKEYSEILENTLPVHEKELSSAEQNLNEAKKRQKNAEEMYNATISNAKNLANEVKRGLKDMDLDEKYTYRIAYRGRYYYFTYMDKQLRLCLIRDIPEYEKEDLWNNMASNELFIDKFNTPQL